MMFKNKIKTYKDLSGNVLLENNETNLSESMNDYARLITLNKRIDTFFKKRNKEISIIGKEKEKEKINNL